MCVLAAADLGPYVPFEELRSNESQWRLSVCRPHGAFQDSSIEGGVPKSRYLILFFPPHPSCSRSPACSGCFLWLGVALGRYAHITGGVDFRRRSPYILASTMGFLLQRNTGAFMERYLSQAEIASVHECLAWGRQPGNNAVLAFYGTVFEAYANASDTLMGRLRTVLPQGSLKCRVRASARESRDARQGTLLDTLGEETVALHIPSLCLHARVRFFPVLSLASPARTAGGHGCRGPYIHRTATLRGHGGARRRRREKLPENRCAGGADCERLAPRQ